MHPLLFIASLIIEAFAAMAQTNEPAAKKSPAETMREMRLKQLTMVPSDFGEKSTAEFPQVCAVIMDWPIEPAIATVIARATGDASIYTTGTFGVIGGIGHERVRIAARECVKVAQHYYDAAIPTKEYPYPASNHLRFYLVCYDGVRVIDTDWNVVNESNQKHLDLYGAAQRVVTELRLIAENQKAKER